MPHQISNRIFIVSMLTTIMIVGALTPACASSLYNYPLDNYKEITKNFGEYRIYGKADPMLVIGHEGIDLRGSAGANVYPVDSGYAFQGNDPAGYGIYVVVVSGNHETLYAHLSEVPKEIRDDVPDISQKGQGGTGFLVTTSTVIGKIGHTGNSEGTHLHFGIAPYDYRPYYGVQKLSSLYHPQLNPLNNSYINLNQPQSYIGKPEIFDNPVAAYSSSKCIKVFSKGADGAWYENNFQYPSKPLRFVSEISQKITSAGNSYFTNPYKIEIMVVKTSNGQSKVVEKTIQFDDISSYAIYPKSPTYPIDKNYSLEFPIISKPMSEKNYFYLDWTPAEAGMYTVTVKAYSCYVENGQVKLTDPEPGVSWVSRTITVGLNYIDYTDPTWGYAWNPNTGGVAVAAVSTGIKTDEARVSAAGVTMTGLGPEIFYNDVSDIYLSPRPDDTDFQNYTDISARSRTPANWEVYVKDQSGAIISTLHQENTSFLSVRWLAPFTPGKFSYQINAIDPSTGNSSLAEGVADIVVDTQKPGFNFYPSPFPSIITSSDETVAFQFSPNEDLYSVIVNVIYSATGAKVVEGLAVDPNLMKGETMSIKWVDAGHYANGSYVFEIVMTDLAGNVTTFRTNSIGMNIPGNDEPPPPPPPPPPGSELPPPGNEKMSGVAVDGKGFIYATYPAANRVVKFDPTGANIIASIESFDGTPLNHPMGVAVAPSGDRIYVADTYNRRVLILDSGFCRFSTIEGKGVYKIAEIKKYKDNYCWVFQSEERDDSEDIYYDQEHYFLPTDLFLSELGDLFVVDSQGHRILRYNRDGKPCIFGKVEMDVLDINNEIANGGWGGTGNIGIDIGRILGSIGNGFSGRDITQHYLKSNEINDDFYLDFIFTPWNGNFKSPQHLIWRKGEDINLPIYDGDISSWSVQHFIPGAGAGAKDGQLSSPFSAGSNPFNELFAADTGNNRIEKYDLKGSFASFFGNSGSFESRLNSPEGIAVDEFGIIYVSDTGNHRVKEFSPNGEYLRSYGASGIIPMPLGLVVKRVDNRKTFYVADGTKDKIQIFTGQTPPTDFRLTSTAEVLTGSKENKVKWTTPEAWSGIKKFQIYGRKASAEAWEMLTNNINPTSNEASFTLVDDGIYDIKVRAVAKEGSWRDTDGSTSDLEPGDPLRLLQIVCVTVPPNVFAIIEPPHGSYLTSRRPLIKWSRPEDEHLDHYSAEIATGEAGFGPASLFSSGIVESVVTTWEAPSELSGGTYYIKVSAYDSLGNKTDAFSMFSIDNTPPAITNVAISHKYFSPLVSKTDVIKFTLTDDATTELKSYNVQILNKDDNLIADIASGESVSAGTYSAFWDGGAPDGAYHLKIEARDLADNLISYSDQINVDTISPEASDVSAAPILFSPNNDGFDDTATVRFKVSEPGTAYIFIQDKEGKTVKTAQLNDLSSGETSEFVWDGYTDAKELIQGEYVFSIRLKDLAGNGSEIYLSNQVSLDLTPYLIAVNPSPEVMSQVIPQPKPIVFYCSVSKQVTLEAGIFSGAAKVKTLLAPSICERGDYTLNWDGKNDSGDNAAEGIYGYEFTAKTPDETVAKKGEVRIDNTPPVVSGVKIDPDAVKLSQPAVLTYHLSERSSVKIDLLDDSRSAVLSPVGSQFQEAGDHSVSIESSGLSAGQEYSVRIRAEDEAGNISVISPVKLSVISSLSLLDVREDPSPFSPNADGLNDLARIHYKIAGGVGEIKLTLKILNPAGGTVKTMRNDDIAFPGSSIDYWDGSGDSGVTPGDGEYTYRLEVRDSQGNFAAREGSVTLVRNPDVTVYVGPSSFSPNGDGFQDQTIIHYILNYSNLLTGESLVSIKIYDQTGNEVHSFLQSYTQGSYTHAWDGRNEQGNYVPDGNYRINMTVKDPVGTIVTNSLSVLVITTGPSIMISTPSPATFTPNGDGINDETLIGYSISSEGATGPVTVSIYNSATVFDPSTLVRRLTGSASGGTIWDGRVEVRGENGDLDGDGFADKGLYTVVIEAADGVGNKTSAVGGVPVTVEKILLNIENLSESGNPSPKIISPNGNSANNKASIKFRLSTSPEPTPPAYAKSLAKTIKAQGIPYCVGKVTIKIKDAAGNVIKTVMNNAPCYKDTVCDVSSGSSWDGMNSATGKAADEGTYKVEITATDMVGDQAQNSLISEVTPNFDPIVVDNTPPDAAIDSPISGAILGRTLTIEGIANDANFGSYLLEYGEGNSPSNWIRIGTDEASPVSGGVLGRWDTLGKNGDYTIRLTAVDAAGNISTSKKTLSIDNIPPTVIIGSPAGSSLHRDSVVILGTATDEIPAHFDSFTVYYASGESASGGWVLLGTSANPATNGTLGTFNTNGLNDGKYTLRLVAQDKAGNQSESKINISTDNTPPVASIITPVNDSWMRAVFNITGSAYDANPGSYVLERTLHGQNSWAEIASGNGNVSNETLASWSTDGLNGDYDIRLKVTDAVGHTTETTPIACHVDNLPPTLSVSGETSFNPYLGELDVHYNVSDNMAGGAYVSATLEISDTGQEIRTIKNNMWETGSKSLVWEGLNEAGDFVNDGEYILKIKARDLAGNERDIDYVINLCDDCRLTYTTPEADNPAGESRCPLISWNSNFNNMNLNWLSGYVDSSTSTRATARAGTFSTDTSTRTFTLDFTQQVYIDTGADNYITSSHSYSDSAGHSWSADIKGSDYTVMVPAGAVCTVWARAHADASAGEAWTAAYYMGRKFYEQSSVGLYDLADNPNFYLWADNTPSSPPALDGLVGPLNYPPDICQELDTQKYPLGTKVYQVTTESESKIYYQRKTVGSYQIIDYDLSLSKTVAITPGPLGHSNGDMILDTFYVDHPQNIVFTADNNTVTVDSDHYLLDAGNNQVCHYYAHHIFGNPCHFTTTIHLNPGTYTVKVQVPHLSPIVYGDSITTTVNYGYRKYKAVLSTASDPVKIVSSPDLAGNPTIIGDDNWNAYIAWQDNRDGKWEIYFQKVPYNFAPLRGTATASMMMLAPPKAENEGPIIQQIQFSTPECVSPKGGTSVQTLRPTFKWYGLKGVTDYRIECAKASDEASLSNAMDYFNTNISYGQAQADRPLGEFTIPLHQMGLDENKSDFNSEPYWYWRVKAISSESVSTSEAASFSIHLPVSISDVINYPNPFNPNKEKTKIRYKLGREANEVAIRIYDITGSLVVELEGTTRGEGAGMMDKYNEVEWDGRNGRGDMVRNGVYPFEVSVSSAGKRVSERGKIVVLK